MSRLSMRPKKTPLRTAALIAAVALILPSLAYAQGTADDEKAAASNDLLSSVWWNQSRFIDHLALSEAIRSQMDDQAKAHLESLDTKRRGELQKELNEALIKGEWDKTTATIEALNEARAEAFAQQTELKVAVLKLLDDAQRQALAENFPRLIDRPWVRPNRGMKARGGRATRR